MGIAAISRGDAIGPGCSGLCRPVTAIAVSGSVERSGGPAVRATVRLTLLDPDAPARDTLERCLGSVLRNTVLNTGPAPTFRALLVAGVPDLPRVSRGTRHAVAIQLRP